MTPISYMATYAYDENFNLVPAAGDDLKQFVDDAMETMTIRSGTISTGSAGTSASASISGSFPSFTINMTIPRGNTGAQGPTGPRGATGPQGPTGSRGATGPQGPSGPAGGAYFQ